MLFGFDSDYFYPHIFTLIRSADAAIVNNIRGQKSSEHDVIIPDITLNIAVGDILIQHLPGDQQQRMIIHDVVPYEKPTIPGHDPWYELKVESADRRITASHTVYNVNNYGTVSQIGQNNVIKTADTKVFEELQSALLVNASHLSEIYDILKALADLKKEKERGSDSYKQKFARLLEVGANAMTVIAPFVSRLL